MPIVALTGGIASGKNTACDQLAQLGVPIVDTDVISHQITRANGAAINAISEQFGQHFINKDQALDRNKMRKLVFNDPIAKTKLESITHPLIREQVTQQVKQNQALLNANTQIHYQLIAVPLLFETDHYQKLIDYAVVIDCEPELQVARAVARSQLSEATARAIIQSQIPRDERIKRADYVIENNDDISALNVKIDRLHTALNQSCFTISAARSKATNNT